MPSSMVHGSQSSSESLGNFLEMHNYRFDSRCNEQNNQLIHVQNENNLKDWLSKGTVPLSTTIPVEIDGILWL